MPRWSRANQIDSRISIGWKRRRIGELHRGVWRTVHRLAGLCFRRRRRFRRMGRWLPPAISPPGLQTTCRHVPQECRDAPVPLRWPAVTHSRPPVAPQWWEQDPLSCCALAPVGPPARPPVSSAVNRAARSPPSFTPHRLAAARAAFVRAEIRSAYRTRGHQAKRATSSESLHRQQLSSAAPTCRS
jgi:hypothetical protein